MMGLVAPTLLVVVSVGLVLFWCRQFVELMLLSDSDFPGRHDKILWVAAFFLAFFLAPFVFTFWKQAYIAMRAEERNEERHTASWAIRAAEKELEDQGHDHT